MSTKSLHPSERLALTSGSVLKVRIVGEDSAGFTVTLPFQQTQTKPVSEPQSRVQSQAPFQSKQPFRKADNTYNNNRDTRKPRPAAKEVKGLTEVPADGIMLNVLKTGHKLQAEVLHSTYACAFVSCNVYRRAKGGLVAQASGLLRREDVPKTLLSPASKKTLLDKGEKLTVYVKEVFKNAGYVLSHPAFPIPLFFYQLTL